MRKYITEFGLNVFTSLKTLIPVERVREFNEEGKYHIYMILSFPRTKIDKNTVNINEKGISFNLVQGEDENEKKYNIEDFNVLNNFNNENTECSVKSYGEILEIKYSIEDIIKHFNKIYSNTIEKQKLKEIINSYKEPIKIEADYFLKNYLYNNNENFPMEVLYIGQSYGENGNRKAQDRLKSHSTLQEILEDSCSRYRERRVMALLLQITPMQMSTIDGINKQYEVSDKEDTLHTQKVLDSSVNEKQVVNITEAALINYFKPYYNKNFVENFPLKSHTGYKEYYNLDYNCISVELDLEFDKYPNIVLFTKTNTITCYWDVIEYNLHNDVNRKNMYNIFSNS